MKRQTMRPARHYQHCGNLAAYLHDISTQIPILLNSKVQTASQNQG
jgi:hypothetical protein